MTRVLLSILILASALQASAQGYPSKPVQMVVNFPPGGAAEVSKAAPDGHTILMSSGGAIALNGLLYANLGYDPMKTLEPVAPVASVAVFLQVKPAIAANSLGEFIAHLRANPGKLNYGSPGNGSSPHLAGEMFNRAAKVQTTHVQIGRAHV